MLCHRKYLMLIRLFVIVRGDNNMMLNNYYIFLTAYLHTVDDIHGNLACSVGYWSNRKNVGSNMANRKSCMLLFIKTNDIVSV